MKKADFQRMLGRLTAKRAKNEHALLSVHLRLENPALDNFYVDASQIEFEEGFAILPLGSIDFRSSQVLFLAYDRIVGLVHNTELDLYELVVEDAALGPLRRLFNQVVEREARRAE